MKTVRVHRGCIGQAKVVAQEAEPPAPPCRCKKMISYEEANYKVSIGEAKWVVTSRERGTHIVLCRICARLTDDKEKAHCDLCKGEGRITVPWVWDRPTDKEIVLTGRGGKGFKQKTPRVATIEEEHITYAYVDKDKEALERIKEYANMEQWLFRDKGAAILVNITGKAAKEERVIHNGLSEPPNKRIAHPPGTITFKDGTKNTQWWWETEGRDFDYGRAI